MSSAAVRKLIESLEALKNLGFEVPAAARVSNSKVSVALNAVFRLGKSKYELTSEDAKVLGPLVASVIPQIKLHTEGVFLKPRSRLESSVLRKRSALQFLIDDYSRFPTGSSSSATVGSELKRLNIDENIKVLDDIIDNWIDVHDSSEGDSEAEEGLPNSHVWWSSFQ